MATHQSDLLDLVSQPIGFVKQASGQATASSLSGEYRSLHSGDPVYPFDKVINQAGVIVVEFTDGSRLDMGPGDQTVLNQEVFSFDEPAEAASTSTDIEALQQALLAGADPTQVLEPTAAGPVAGASPDIAEDSGTGGIATIARDGSQTIAANGFATNDGGVGAFADTASELESDEFINSAAISITTGTTAVLASDPPEVPTEPAPLEIPSDPTSQEIPTDPTPPEIPFNPEDTTGPIFNSLAFDLAELSTAGTIVGQLTATDVNGPVSYQFNTATDLFEVDSETGVITLTNIGAAAELLDFETIPNLAELSVIATDSVGNQTTQSVSINITNINEAPIGEDDAGFIKIGVNTGQQVTYLLMI